MPKTQASNPAVPANFGKQPPPGKVLMVQGKKNNNQQQQRGGRKDSGGGGKRSDNQAGAKKPQQMSAAAALQSNRYGKGARGFGGPPQAEVVQVVPPLYPTAPKPPPLNPEMMDKVLAYIRISQKLSTNYGVHVQRKQKGPFNVDRYTDRYHAPLTLNPDIVHRVGFGRFPEELSTVVKVKKARVAPKIKDITYLDKLEAGEKNADSKDLNKEPSPDDEMDAEAADIIDEEEMEEPDDELDLGTDYASNFFDNGESFLDSDHDGDDDGPSF